MKASELYPSKYIKSEDLEDQKHTLIIADIQIEEIGKEKQKKPVLYFKERDKGLVMNKTNWTTVIGMWGDDTDSWIGKPITIGAMEVESFGEMVMAVRVSIKKPTMNQLPTKAPNQDDLKNKDEIPF